MDTIWARLDCKYGDKCEDRVFQFKELFPKFDQDQQTFERKSQKVIEGFYNQWKGENKVAKDRFRETLFSETWKALSKYEQNAQGFMQPLLVTTVF